MAADEYVPNEVLVKFKPSAKSTDRMVVQTSLSAERLHTFLSGVEHWRTPPNISVEESLSFLRQRSEVEYTEPNSIGFLMTHADPNRPNDEFFLDGKQWNLASDRLMLEEVWEHITSGDPNVIVAVPDSGVDWDHEDLADNMWINPGEDINSNGAVDGINTCPTPNGDFNCVDDDSNGFVDDIRGWNFTLNNNDPMGPPHGTMVAGVIGAVGDNGVGLAGINWTVKIMPLRSTASPSTVMLSNVTAAVDYASSKGAHIINVSWGFDCSEQFNTCHQTLRDAMAIAGDRDVLIVAGAGNNNKNIDSTGEWLNPVGFNLDNIVGVAGTSMGDGKWTGSNYGAVSVDIAAPAELICSTLPDGYNDICMTGTHAFDGTSAAAPHVVGVAALMKAVSPDVPFELAKQQLLMSTSGDLIIDFSPSGPTPIVTGKRVNAFKALTGFDPNAPAQITDLFPTGRTNSSVTLEWTATGDDGSVGQATLYHLRYSLSPINASNWRLATKATGVPAPASQGVTESFTVVNLSCSTTYYFGLKAFDEWGNGPLSNIVSMTTKNPLCMTTYCRNPSERCNWSGVCGPGGCCPYTCFYDETCPDAEQGPPNACS